MARRDCTRATFVLGLLLLIGLFSPGSASAACPPDDGVDCTRTATGQVPMTNPGGEGLYISGSNTRPAEHAARGIAIGAALKAQGNIVAACLGMSVTKQDCRALIARVRNLTPAKFVNCAQGGETAENWADPANGIWTGCRHSLMAEGLSPLDVDVVLLQSTLSKPSLAQWTEDAFVAELTAKQQKTIDNATDFFGNLQQVYVLSLDYMGYDDQNYQPEPFGWLTGRAAKNVVQNSIANPTKRPFVDHGPYFWNDGLVARSGDGKIWKCDPAPYKMKNGVLVPTYNNGHVGQDGVHHNVRGEALHVDQLVNYFATDPTTPWYR